MNESELRISETTFTGIVKKIVPDWDIIIEPKNFTKHPELYNSVTITVSNQNLAITRKTTIPVDFSIRPPAHYFVLVYNIASLICRETKKDEDDLSQKIFNQFTEYFESQNKHKFS